MHGFIESCHMTNPVQDFTIVISKVSIYHQISIMQAARSVEHCTSHELIFRALVFVFGIGRAFTLRCIYSAAIAQFEPATTTSILLVSTPIQELMIPTQHGCSRRSFRPFAYTRGTSLSSWIEPVRRRQHRRLQCKDQSATHSCSESR